MRVHHHLTSPWLPPHPQAILFIYTVEILKKREYKRIIRKRSFLKKKRSQRERESNPYTTPYILLLSTHTGR
jgi:uncharacterized protein involved in tolerance to divalent cations